MIGLADRCNIDPMHHICLHKSQTIIFNIMIRAQLKPTLWVGLSTQMCYTSRHSLRMFCDTIENKHNKINSFAYLDVQFESLLWPTFAISSVCGHFETKLPNLCRLLRILLSMTHCLAQSSEVMRMRRTRVRSHDSSFHFRV